MMRPYGRVREKGIIVFLFLFSLIINVYALDIVDDVQTYGTLTNTVVNMSGVSELHITSDTTPISGCTINLNSVDSFFFLEQIKPSVVQSTYLSQVRVSGAAAVLNTNCRIVQYVAGTVIIPHSSSYQPMTVYSGFNFTGSSVSLGLYTYYKGSASLGTLNNHISSFKLKRGYMATFAQNENGTGLSRNYVAQDADISIVVIPKELDNSISFVRVFPWRWAAKKGIKAGGGDADWLECNWNYDYANDKTSTLDREYVPQRHNPNWQDYANINNKQNSTHAMGYNEPDNPDDNGYSTVADAIAAWPNLMASGLRLVSPGPRDSGTWWLYDFIDQADALNYRVDAVAIHYYRDNESISTIKNWLAGIHNRTGRPIWVTEWNDGCNWSGGDPSDPYVHADRIIEMAQAMDDLPFVERYAVYSECSYRELISGGILTPAGVAYQEHIAPAAYLQAPGKGGIGCAYYEFEDNTLDSSFYENNGFAHGTEAYTTGHSGQAIDLDGTSDYVMLPENLTDCTDFTFAVWVYWDGGNQWQRIFDFGANSLRYMFLTPRSGNNTLRFAITADGTEQQIETTQLATGSWVHVAVTISGDTGKLFVNGSQSASNTSMTINPSELKALSNYLGRSHFVTDPLFNGRLDNVYIANYAMTNTEVANLYSGTAGNLTPGFTSNPLTKPPVVPGTAYNDTIFYDAGDIDSAGLLTFSKINGPSWLNIASDGTISGMPTVNDAGTNSFTVRATDYDGASTDATLNITVSAFGLQNHYEFEGHTDDSVGASDGSIVGSPIYVEGYAGQGINFDATDDYIILPSNLIYSNDVTIAAWIYWNGGDNWQRIFDFGNDTTQYLFLTPSSGSNTLRFAIKNSGGEQIIETSKPATGQWVHVAVTLNGNTGTLYVNGSPAASNASMTLNPTDIILTNNYIGDSQWTADPLFNGRIDDFRIYNYALSGSEITEIASQAYLPSTKRMIVAHTAGAEETGNPGVNSYDNDGITRWANTGLVSNAWIQYDLGSSYVIDRIQISFNHGETRTFPLRIEVDGTIVFNGNTSTSNGYWVTTFNPVSGRYVKITMTGNNSDGNAWISIFETEIWASAFPPSFTTNPIINIDAIELTNYVGNSLANYAEDLDGIETVTFSKDSGPNWLMVAGDGTLSGTPGDSGSHVFTVRATDIGGLYDTAIMTIQVANVYSGVEGIDDLIGLAENWLAADCTDTPACDGADLDGDLDVDMDDLSRQAHNWLADEDNQLYLKLDETGGDTAADSSIYDRPGTLVNSPTWSTEGVSGGALSFDGTDDYVTVLYTPALNAVDFTVAFWARVDGNTGVYRAPVCSRSAVGGFCSGYNVFAGSSNTWDFWTGKGTAFEALAGPAVTNGEWTHVTVTFEATSGPDVSGIYTGTKTTYINGASAASTTTGLYAPNTSEPFTVGRINHSQLWYFNGLVDEVRVYNRVLSAAEIEALVQ